MLELKNIHKSFGERKILSGINLKRGKGKYHYKKMEAKRWEE